MSHSSLIFRQLTYKLPNNKSLLTDLSFSLPKAKHGLVGNNGLGKSTLLKLITGELIPTAGKIECNMSVSYLPQDFTASDNDSIASVLSVEEKLAAFNRVLAGDCCESDFELIADDWDLVQTIENRLAEFGLSQFTPDTKVKNLSGGQRTRLLLCKVFANNCDFILLDEPTNNLDSESRNLLYHKIISSEKAMLIVSHDRKLLQLMDNIAEISSLGIKLYGGNYDHYIAQKNTETQAAHNSLQARVQSLEKAKQSIQTRKERHQQNQAKGNSAKHAEIKAKGRYDKIAIKSGKGRSENTNRRITTQANRKLAEVDSQLEQAKAKIEIKSTLDLSLNNTLVPNGKIMIEAADLCFHYPNQTQNIIEKLNFIMQGPERVGLIGSNGSGKTTLVKLICQQLQPSSGTINCYSDNVAYLDQQASQLQHDLSLLDNFKRLNPDATLEQAHRSLARFLFRNVAANKLVKELSGGEKLRAFLACILMSATPPQLLILDEPTNHLDLDSIQAIESALQQYQGAMLVISHDKVFLRNINVQRFIHL